MAVITISRMYGIGGREFGRSLAERLGYEYFDKELLAMLSKKLGKGSERVDLYEHMDYEPSKGLLAMLGRKYPSTLADFPDTDRYGLAITEILKDLCDRDRVVIVGRGGQAVLAGHPRVLHLRLVADEPFLLERLSRQPRYRGCSREELVGKIRHHGDVRRRFVRLHFDLDWSDPLNYHLVINLGLLDPMQAESMIVALLETFDAGTDGKALNPV